MSFASTSTAFGQQWNKTSDDPIVAKRDFAPPVQAVDDGWMLNFETEERDLLIRLMGELRELLTGPDDNPLINRLFPETYPDDAEKEAEYQRLMREELVESRVSAIDSVTETLGREGSTLLSEGDVFAFLQSINAIRLVLGSMLGITDDESADEADERDTSEHNLYDFLGWILEWTVRSLSPN